MVDKDFMAEFFKTLPIALALISLVYGVLVLASILAI